MSEPHLLARGNCAKDSRKREVGEQKREKVRGTKDAGAAAAGGEGKLERAAQRRTLQRRPGEAQREEQSRWRDLSSERGAFS